jgi:hypothetical protein
LAHRRVQHINVDFDIMFDNLNYLRAVQIPPGYPKVDLNQTRETLKEGAPKKGTSTFNFEHACKRAQYDNHKGMHNHIDVMMEKFAKKEEKPYHLCFPCSFLYFIPGITIALLSLILQKQNFWIIVDPKNAIFDGNTGNTNAQMPKPGVDRQRNPAVYDDKALLRHWVYIWRLRQWYPDRDLLLYKDNINATFRIILYHPEIYLAFTTMLQHMLCIPVGLIFWAAPPLFFFCNTSECRSIAATPPPMFVPEAMPAPASATILTDGRALASRALDMFKSAKMLAPLTASIRLPDPPKLLESSHMRTHLVPDPLYPSLLAVLDHGSHHVTAERHAILAMLNVSVLSDYLIYGFLGDARRGPPLTEDKYEAFTHYHQEHLSLEINTRNDGSLAHLQAARLPEIPGG